MHSGCIDAVLQQGASMTPHLTSPVAILLFTIQAMRSEVTLVYVCCLN